MDKLQWFKFTPTDWIMGKIQKTPESTQARFMRLICLYWNKECSLTIEDAEIEIDKKHLDLLIFKKIITTEDLYVKIKFLDEQLFGISETSQKRRDAVNKRWAKNKVGNTLEIQNHTSVLQNDTEKRREEKNKESIKKKPAVFTPPILDEVKAYFLEKGYSAAAAVKAFDYYDSANWHDASGKPVKSWKQKMQGVWFRDENKVYSHGQTKQVIYVPQIPM